MALEVQSALSTLLDALTTAEDGTLMRRILQGALQGLIIPRKTSTGLTVKRRRPGQGGCWPRRRPRPRSTGVVGSHAGCR